MNRFRLDSLDGKKERWFIVGIPFLIPCREPARKQEPQNHQKPPPKTALEAVALIGLNKASSNRTNLAQHGPKLLQNGTKAWLPMVAGDPPLQPKMTIGGSNGKSTVSQIARRPNNRTLHAAESPKGGWELGILNHFFKRTHGNKSALLPFNWTCEPKRTQGITQVTIKTWY